MQAIQEVQRDGTFGFNKLTDIIPAWNYGILAINTQKNRCRFHTLQQMAEILCGLPPVAHRVYLAGQTILRPGVWRMRNVVVPNPNGGEWLEVEPAKLGDEPAPGEMILIVSDGGDSRFPFAISGRAPAGPNYNHPYYDGSKVRLVVTCTTPTPEDGDKIVAIIEQKASKEAARRKQLDDEAMAMRIHGHVCRVVARNEAEAINKTRQEIGEGVDRMGPVTAKVVRNADGTVGGLGWGGESHLYEVSYAPMGGMKAVKPPKAPKATKPRLSVAKRRALRRARRKATQAPATTEPVYAGLRLVA